MERGTWTDERIDERMTAIDGTFDRAFDELKALRADMHDEFRAVRSDISEIQRQLAQIGEFRSVRADISAVQRDISGLQRQLAQIGWGVVGALTAVLISVLVTLIVALA
jgi:hypothetical protein